MGDLTTGRAWQPKENTGGVRAVYFADFGELSGLTVSAGEIAAAGLAGVTLYKYSVKKYSANLEETLNITPENGTRFYDQNLNMTLNKLRAADRAEFASLVSQRPHCIVEDNNGNFLLMGYQQGCDITSGTAGTGTAGNDLSGYTFTVNGKEQDSFPFIENLSSAAINNG